MIPLTPELALDLWYQAAQAELGITFTVPNPADVASIRTALYQARGDIKDPRLKAISLYTTEDGGTFCLYQHGVELT
jgi:hypothetical protein